MTEGAVRALVIKHYSAGDLNEVLMAATEELRMAILKETGEESWPDIVKTIFSAQSKIYLFNGMVVSGNMKPSVPMSYISHFDQIRKAFLDVVRYMYDNYETVQPWFRMQFEKEHLKLIFEAMSEFIEKPTGMAPNVRGLNFKELELEEDFFATALIGILGVERFQKLSEEYNKSLKIIRQCQAEGEALSSMKDMKTS